LRLSVSLGTSIGSSDISALASQSSTPRAVCSW
jgi:hypothetical protein